MYQVRTIDENEFLDLRDRWNDLVLKMWYPVIFCTWEWVCTWRKTFVRDDQLKILLILEHQEVRGILPLFVENHRLFNLVSVSILKYCGSTHVYPDHLDIICHQVHAADCLKSVFSYLESNNGDWDLIELPYVAEDSSVARWAEGKRGNGLVRFDQTSVAPYIPLDGDYNSYLSMFGKKTRYTIRKKQRKLADEMGVKYVTCVDSELESCMKELFQIHRERAQDKEMVSTFEGDLIERFHYELVKLLQDKRWAWLRFLNDGKVNIAAFYGFDFAGRTFFYQIGHRKEWDDYSPGMLLLHESIRESCEKGNKEYNLLQGSESYKQRLAKHSRKLFRLRVYNTSWKARLLMYYEKMRTVAKRMVRILEQT